MMKRLLFTLAVAVTTTAMADAPKKGGDATIEQGRRVFETNCSSCHGAGIGNPGAQFRTGTDALRVKYKGEMPALLSERTDLTPDTVAYFVRNGVSVMAPYRKTEIDDAQLAALGAYLSKNNPDLKGTKGKQRGRK
jgi:mono/diheme cytochrome c family protein